MESMEVKCSLDLLHKLFISQTGGDDSLQARIRGVINATAKLPKLNLSLMPPSSLLVELLEHLTDQGAKPDTLLLGGTCVVRLLCRFLTPEAASNALRELLLTSPSCLASLKPHLDSSLPSPNSSPPTEASSHPTFYHLCLIHGALTAGTDTYSLLTCRTEKTAASPLIMDVLSPLISLVHDDNVSRYHTVSTLLLWFKTVEQLQSANPNSEDEEVITAACALIGNIFTPESNESTIVLSAIDANWESPVNGVSDLVRKVYQSLLRVTDRRDLSKKARDEQVASSSPGALPGFHRFLLERTMRLGWKAKPKYLSLACLMQFVPFELCLKIDPQLPKHAIPGLLANHLVSATMDVYRASLTLSSSEAARKETWSAHWKQPIVDTIKADAGGTCLQNMATHLLPWTVKNVPGSLQDLAKCFHAGREDEVSLHFLVTLARIGTQAGLMTVVLEESLLSQCLVHQSNAIRAEAFNRCCSSYILRAATEKLAADLELISCFVKSNLNVDDSWFRSRHVLLLESVFVALRDNVVGEFSRAARQKERTQNHDAALSTYYGSAFRFVQDMVVMAVENLFPGANYQRAITSLAILESIASTFRVDPSGKQRTNYKRETLEKFFASETSRFGLEPMQKPLRAALLSALFHSVAEVRLSAFRLLTTSGCPILDCGSDLQDVLWATADKCLASPRPQDNAIGSLLVRLYLTNLRKEPEQLASKLEEICSMGENALSVFQQVPVSATTGYPLHGMLLTLVTCLGDVRGILVAAQEWNADRGDDLVGNLLDRALSLAKRSLFHTLLIMVPRGKQHALGAVSTSSTDRVAPSFEDTNIAFAELVADHEAAQSTRLTPEEHRQAEERLTSFCWHCIKNSCSLLELGAAISLKENGVSYPLDCATLQEIADALIAVMTGCRHRGAIESCCDSLRSLCHVLSSSRNSEIADIPFGLLKSALSSLTSRSKSSSITRRSAGLPLLVRALLEGEARNVKRAMSWTVDCLSRVIEEHPEQPYSTSATTTVDVPQAEALHVLCAIVGSASLGTALLTHLGRILWFCFEGLSSPLWLVRNAAHQLYGVTAPRVIGLKKTREEFVGHDAVTALDLFARFPKLRGMFLGKLDCPGSESDELYFVLDFLSRLKPLTRNQQGQESLEPFRRSVRNHLGCRSWKLRLLAAKCTAAFSLSAFDEVASLLADVVTLRTDTQSCNNRAHAELSATNLLLRSYPDCIQDVADWSERSGTHDRLCRALRDSSCSPFVKAEIVNLLDLLSARLDDTRWRQEFYEISILNVARKDSCKEPGSAVWRRRQAQWFLKNAERQQTAEIIAILQTVKEDVDIMESTLDFLLSQAHQTVPAVAVELWCQVVAILVLDLRTGSVPSACLAWALELLAVLLQKPGVANVCVDPTLLATFENLALKATPAAPGTTVRALSLVVWSHCLKRCLEGKDSGSPEVGRSAESWLDAMASAVGDEARLAATVDVWRVHAARSVHVAGRAIYSWAGQKRMGPLQSLFSTLLQLLQDKDPKVRAEAASAIPLERTKQQSLPVQANVAVEILLSEMLTSRGGEQSWFEFFWTELCQICPSALEELQHLLRPTVGSLFEQDESGVFLEPMAVSLVLRDGLQKSLEMAAEKGTDLTHSLLDKATELLEELEATSRALEEFVLQDGKPPGVSLEILGKPRLYHAITTLITRADIIERALKQVDSKLSHVTFNEETSTTRAASKKSSQLTRAATELILAKTRLLKLWTQLTLGDHSTVFFKS